MLNSWRRFSFGLLLMLFAVSVAQRVSAQVVPAATQSSASLKVGAGYSFYNTDIWNNTFVQGPTVWADWYLGNTPRILHGLGIEAESRELLYGQPKTYSWSFATFGGGPVYSYRRYNAVQPYAKFLVNYGAQWNIKASKLPSTYTSDSWIAYAAGGGADIHLRGNLSARVDYEYQFWKTNFFANQHYLNPN